MFPAILKDQDGFTTSFALEQKTHIKWFFQTYGFVIVKDVIDSEQIKLTKKEFFDSFFESSEGKSPSQTDILAFCNSKPFGNSIGGLGDQSSLSVEQLNNRQHPNIHTAFSYLFDTANLIRLIGNYDTYHL
jgi:hypothetical protein